jgi:hypothetical protein
MSHFRKALQRTGICVALGVAQFGAAPHAMAEEDSSRSVKIIDGPSSPAPEPTVPAVPALQKAPEPSTAAPSEVPVEPDHLRPVPSQSAPVLQTIIAPQIPAKASPNYSNQTIPTLANPAEISVEMLPSQSVSIGSRVSFRIRSKRAGYVVLVDIDADGKLRQIFPNIASLTRNARPNSNYIKQGIPLLVPSSADVLGGVAYVVSPPTGNAMVVAIWSEQPVQILDLPDVPRELSNQAEALDYLTKWASGLRIPDNRTNLLHEAKWSFDAKFYAVQ